MKAKRTKMDHICQFYITTKYHHALVALSLNMELNKIYCEEGFNCLEECPYSYKNRKVEEE